MEEPWECPQPDVWLAATVLRSPLLGLREPWLQVDRSTRRTLKELLRRVPLGREASRREVMDLLAEAFLRRSTDEKLARIPAINPPAGRTPLEQKGQALRNLARVRRALNQLLDACKKLDGLSLTALEQAVWTLEPGQGSSKSLLEDAVKLSRVEFIARGRVQMWPDHTLGLAPSEQDRIELLAAKRLAWLWWRATGKTPTCPRRKVQITKSVEGQEYYGPFIDLVRGFFSLANLVKPDSNADQAVRWLPSVIENFSGQQFGNIR
jgi:hypothetical protein